MNVRQVTLFVALMSLGCQNADRSDVRSDLNNSHDLPSLTLEHLQEDTFRYFWETTDATTGLAPDRFPSDSPASIAAVGFALTAYPIGVNRGLVSREEAEDRTLTTLRYLSSLPTGNQEQGTAGFRGFYYHFLNMDDGLRFQGWEVELSTVDTALLMAGVLFAQSFFDQSTPNEIEIRNLAENLYRRVDWQWAQNQYPSISLGWFPSQGFIKYDWVGYNEAMLVYVLALGSPTFPVEQNAWSAWVDHYADDWGGTGDSEHLTFGPMFGHQYSHIWIDFREIQDEFMVEKGSDYFINSRKATYAQQAYAVSNPAGWDGYDENVWGLTACDGPGEFNEDHKGIVREFRGYSARGLAMNQHFDDGTLAPTAVAGSLPFAPDIVIPAIETIYDRYGTHLYSTYGFLDAFNPTFKYKVTPQNGKIVEDFGWLGTDYVGIDQGPILAMGENHSSELIWRTMRKNPHIRRGLKKAGFVGGWLDNSP